MLQWSATYVMRLSKLSLNSYKIKTQFSFPLYTLISDLYYAENPIKIEHTVPEMYLGVQQCFGVVYHELTTLRRVYFARAALAVRAKLLKM